MIADERPFVPLAASAALVSLAAAGVCGWLWLGSDADRLAFLAALAVAGANVVCACLVAAGARPGRLLPFRSAWAHAWWASSAAAAALAVVTPGLQAAGVPLPRAAWLAAFVLACLGGLCERRACLSGLPFVELWPAVARHWPDGERTRRHHGR